MRGSSTLPDRHCSTGLWRKVGEMCGGSRLSRKQLFPPPPPPTIRREGAYTLHPQQMVSLCIACKHMHELRDCLMCRSESHSWPRKLWFSICSCTDAFIRGGDAFGGFIRGRCLWRVYQGGRCLCLSLVPQNVMGS